MATRRIKGITIEIGGDTTKLDKALKGTDAEIRNTKKDLKDVEKLLKLDPGNVDLLEQKQKLLNDQLRNTSIRLDTVRLAADQANDALAAGKIDQAQYDAIQRELFETEEAYKAAKKEVEAFHIEAERISAVAEKVSDGAGKIADKTKWISGAAAGAVTGLVGLAVQAGKTADDLNTMAKQSGFSTEDIQKWQYAADLIDVSVEDIVGSAGKLKKNMASTSSSVQEAFAKLGVAVKTPAGEYRDSTEVFYQTLDALSHIPNETERDIIAMTLFGKSADSLAGIVDDGGQALRELGEQAKNAGMILDQDALDSANKFNDGLDELKAKGKASFAEVGATLADNFLPAMENLLDFGTKLLAFVAGLDSNVLTAITGILAAVALIAPVAKTVSIVSGAFGNLVTVFSKLTPQTAILYGGLALIAMAVGAVMAAWDDMSGLQKVVAILGLVTAAALTAAVALGAFQSAATLGLAAVGIAAGVAAVLVAVKSAQKSAESMASSSKQVPHLAQGGVTGVNRPFMAVVGDNPNEPEVIAPYSMIRQAAQDAMAANGGGGPTTINIRFTGSLAQLGRVLKPVIDAEDYREGPSMVGGM